MKILNASIKFKEVALDVGIVVLIGAKEIPEWESNARKHGQELTADQIANLITDIAEQKLNSVLVVREKLSYSRHTTGSLRIGRANFATKQTIG